VQLHSELGNPSIDLRREGLQATIEIDLKFVQRLGVLREQGSRFTDQRHCGFALQRASPE